MNMAFILTYFDIAISVYLTCMQPAIIIKYIYSEIFSDNYLKGKHTTENDDIIFVKDYLLKIQILERNSKFIP